MRRPPRTLRSRKRSPWSRAAAWSASPGRRARAPANWRGRRSRSAAHASESGAPDGKSAALDREARVSVAKGPARRESASVPRDVKPMLATLVDEPFHLLGWVYEEKYDGIRIIAEKDGSRVRLITRNLIDRTADFAEVAAAVAKLPAPTLLLDGEVVV